MEFKVNPYLAKDEYIFLDKTEFHNTKKIVKAFLKNVKKEYKDIYPFFKVKSYKNELVKLSAYVINDQDEWINFELIIKSSKVNNYHIVIQHTYIEK